jgi:hypothetical protein
MKQKEGDESVAEDLGRDIIILKKVSLRALLEDAIEKDKSIDLDKLEREIDGGEQPVCPPEIQGIFSITPSSSQQSNAGGLRARSLFVTSSLA